MPTGEPHEKTSYKTSISNSFVEQLAKYHDLNNSSLTGLLSYTERGIRGLALLDGRIKKRVC